MANGSGKKFKNKGSSYPHSSSRIIDKRAGKEKKENASRINSNSLFVPTVAPNHAFAPAYPNVPAFASAPASTNSCNWAAVQGEMMPCDDQISGYIFMCNGKTKMDCYKYRVFGLPAARMEVVEKIKPHTKLFLFDFDLKLLYGIYIAASNGQLGIEPTAFRGKFSAQVRFEIFKDCLPLPESAFKHVIKDNSKGGSKFRQELSDEQVVKLISMFRPIAMPPLVTAVLPAKVLPLNIEVRTRPAVDLSASYDQYLAGLHFTHAGPAHDSRHVQQVGHPFPHVPHALAANMVSLQPAVQSMHLPPVVPQPHCDPYYPADAHQAYFPENPALFPQNPHSRYSTVLDDSERGLVPESGATNNYKVLSTANASVQAHALVHSQFSTPLHGPVHLPSSSRTAAYWAAVAAEDPKQVYSSPHQRMPSASTGLGGKNVSAGAASTCPAVPEDSERQTVARSGTANDYNHNLAFAATNAPVQAHATVPLQFQAPLNGPAYSSSSSSATAYWTAVASEDPKQVYSVPDQTQPPGGTGLGAENVPVSFSGAALSHAALPEKSEKEIVSQLGSAYGPTHNIAVSSANAPLQTHLQVPSQVPEPLVGPAHLPSSSESAAYWTVVASEDPHQVYSGPYQRVSSGSSTAYVYNHNVAVSTAKALLQAYAPVPSQVPALAHLPSSSESAAYWTFVAPEDPNQVYSGPHQRLPSRNGVLGENMPASCSAAPTYH